MFYSKSFALIGGVALAVAPTMNTEAFTATIISTISPSHAHSPLCALMPSDDDGAVSESRRKLGFATAASAFALLFPSSANAVEIVTMDMSMPGTYVRSWMVVNLDFVILSLFSPLEYFVICNAVLYLRLMI